MRTVSALVWASALLCVAEGKVKVVPPQDKIKHVVVLMEENRSFDHMCGFFPGVNGLNGTEYNLLNVSDPNSKRIYVNKTSPYVGPFDPNHGCGATTDKVYGVTDSHQPSAHAVPTMDGFAQFEGKHHKDPSSVLNMFTPETLPVMSTLAAEFNLFDKFFCSVSGPTWPNRLFQLLGTSRGDTSTSHWNDHGVLYPGKTLFDLFDEAGYESKFYYADVPLEAMIVERLSFDPTKFHTMDDFKKDARQGSLPTFSYMNPRWFVDPVDPFKGANDQHPDHNVANGERLMKDVYEILRDSPNWNNTLFIITYDEHGGFYDHVPTEEAPAPGDDIPSFPEKDFGFNRTGLRVPTMLISPWVEKGKVIGAPENQGDSQYELTSIIKTMREMFGLGEPLTKRDAWAASFADQFLDTPRTDCPMTLPDAPKMEENDHLREAAQPLNHLQQDIVNAVARMRGLDAPLSQEDAMPKLQGEGKAWADKIVAEILSGKTFKSEQ